MSLFLPFFPSFPSFFSHFALILSNIPKTFVIFVKKLPENLERVVFCYTFASAFGQKTPPGHSEAGRRSLKDLHGDIRSSTRGSAALPYFWQWRALGIDMSTSMTGDFVSGALLLDITEAS